MSWDCIMWSIPSSGNIIYTFSLSIYISRSMLLLVLVCVTCRFQSVPCAVFSVFYVQCFVCVKCKLQSWPSSLRGLASPWAVGLSNSLLCLLQGSPLLSTQGGDSLKDKTVLSRSPCWLGEWSYVFDLSWRRIAVHSPRRQHAWPGWPALNDHWWGVTFTLISKLS